MRRCVIVLFMVWVCSGCYAQVTQTGMDDKLDLMILDADGDGILDPYEVMDLLLMMQDSAQQITPDVIRQYIAKQRNEQRAIFNAMDNDGDGVVKVDDLDKNMMDIGHGIDVDGDGEIIWDEWVAFDFADYFLLDSKEITEEVDNIFNDLDEDKDSAIGLDALNSGERNMLIEADVDGDNILLKEELMLFLTMDNTAAAFRVEGSVAYMNGVITSGTPARVLELIMEHPEVRIIELQQVPGSIDDEANLRAAMMVYNHRFTTRLSEHSTVASGGTDFFLAGWQRELVPGARLGVHSWSGENGVEGCDVARDDPEHQKYLRFYRRVGVPDEFYWYTLKVAPAGGIHWMTPREIEKYHVITK